MRSTSPTSTTVSYRQPVGAVRHTFNVLAMTALLVTSLVLAAVGVLSATGLTGGNAGGRANTAIAAGGTQAVQHAATVSRGGVDSATRSAAGVGEAIEFQRPAQAPSTLLYLGALAVAGVWVVLRLLGGFARQQPYWDDMF